MNKRRLRIIKYVAIAVAVMVLAWGASAIAVYAVSSGRVFDSASIDAVPHRRAAVVLVVEDTESHAFLREGVDLS